MKYWSRVPFQKHWALIIILEVYAKVSGKFNPGYMHQLYKTQTNAWSTSCTVGVLKQTQLATDYCNCSGKRSFFSWKHLAYVAYFSTLSTVGQSSEAWWCLLGCTVFKNTSLLTTLSIRNYLPLLQAFSSSCVRSREPYWVGGCRSFSIMRFG